MALVFLLTFTVGDWLKGYFEIFLESFSAAVTSGLTSLHVGDMMISLVVDGIISGVGGILTFLPNIFILFLALAFLEDSGYMARVAFVMDDMGHLGLSGRASFRFCSDLDVLFLLSWPPVHWNTAKTG